MRRIRHQTPHTHAFQSCRYKAKVTCRKPKATRRISRNRETEKHMGLRGSGLAPLICSSYLLLFSAPLINPKTGHFEKRQLCSHADNARAEKGRRAKLETRAKGLHRQGGAIVQSETDQNCDGYPRHNCGSRGHALRAKNERADLVRPEKPGGRHRGGYAHAGCERCKFCVASLYQRLFRGGFAAAGRQPVQTLGGTEWLEMPTLREQLAKKHRE